MSSGCAGPPSPTAPVLCHGPALWSPPSRLGPISKLVTDNLLFHICIFINKRQLPVVFVKMFPNGNNCVLLCSRVQFASAKVPIFSEKAQIITVDTLDGLACTHEVRRHVRLLVNDFLSSPYIIASPPINQVAVPPGCTYEPLKPRTGPPVKVREKCCLHFSVVRATRSLQLKRCLFASWK